MNSTQALGSVTRKTPPNSDVLQDSSLLFVWIIEMPMSFKHFSFQIRVRKSKAAVFYLCLDGFRYLVPLIRDLAFGPYIEMFHS